MYCIPSIQSVTEDTHKFTKKHSTLSPDQSYRYFANAIFKFLFLNQKFYGLLPSLTTTNHNLNQCWPSYKELTKNETATSASHVFSLLAITSSPLVSDAFLKEKNTWYLLTQSDWINPLMRFRVAVCEDDPISMENMRSCTATGCPMKCQDIAQNLVDYFE